VNFDSKDRERESQKSESNNNIYIFFFFFFFEIILKSNEVKISSMIFLKKLVNSFKFFSILHSHHLFNIIHHC
jgi:hypothetical protein